MEKTYVVFYKFEGHVNFRIDGQLIPAESRVLTQDELPDWAIPKMELYRFLEFKYGTVLDFSSGNEIRRWAPIRIVDNNGPDFYDVVAKTFFWGEKRESPSPEFFHGKIMADLEEFASTDSSAEFVIIESSTEWAFVVDALS